MKYTYEIFTLLASFFSYAAIRRLFLSREFRRTENLMKIYQDTKIANNFSQEFNDTFFKPNLEESYFHARTGIRLDSKNIPKIVEFKNANTRSFSWNELKRLMLFIKFDEDSAKLKITRGQLLLHVLYNLLGFVFVIMGVLYAFFNPIDDLDSVLEKMVVLITFFGIELLGFMMIFLVFKIGRVKKISRVIEKSRD